MATVRFIERYQVVRLDKKGEIQNVFEDEFVNSQQAINFIATDTKAGIYTFRRIWIKQTLSDAEKERIESGEAAVSEQEPKTGER